MEFVYLYAASSDDYSSVLLHYKIREITQEERNEGIYGNLIITFDSLEELMRFEDEVGDIVICDRRKNDGTYFKTLIIYDDYLE